MKTYLDKKKEELNNLLNRTNNLEVIHKELFNKYLNNWCELNTRESNNNHKQFMLDKYTKELSKLDEAKNIAKFTEIISIILAIVSIIIGILNLPIAPITYMIFAFSLPISLSCAISADNKKMDLDKKNISKENVIKLKNEIINNSKEIDKLTKERYKHRKDITTIEADLDILKELINNTENIINYITTKNDTESNDINKSKPKTRIKRKETDN